MGEDLLRTVGLPEVEDESVWARSKPPMDLLMPEPKSKRPGLTQPVTLTHGPLPLVVGAVCPLHVSLFRPEQYGNCST